MDDKNISILDEILQEIELHPNDPERQARYSRWAFYIEFLLTKLTNSNK